MASMQALREMPRLSVLKQPYLASEALFGRETALLGRLYPRLPYFRRKVAAVFRAIFGHHTAQCPLLIMLCYASSISAGSERFTYPRIACRGRVSVSESISSQPWTAKMPKWALVKLDSDSKGKQSAPQVRLTFLYS